MRSLLRSAAVAVVVLSSFPGFGQTLSFSKNPAPEYAPGQVLVRFRAGRSVSAKLAAHSRVQAAVRRQYTLVPDLQLVKLSPAVSVDRAIEAYRSDPNVLYAVPNYIRRATQSATPNDPMFRDLWGLHNSGTSGGKAGVDIKALEAWDITKGSKDVVVAVIDSGIDYTHPDLQANIWSNTADCNKDGFDNDGNGYADDCHGIDAANDDSDPMDDHGHGTHVAGTIGAVGNNGVGVVGVNWNTSIIGCKFLSADGYGYDSDAIQCLQYLGQLKQRGVNIVATNNSWGGGGYDPALSDAIKAHRDLGILFIAAAGNAASDNDLGGFYPANYGLPNMISVAATTSIDALADFSDYGRHTVHIGAPGDMIESTLPGNQYGIKSGTSMATPHVTGTVALLAAAHPELDWRGLKNRIISSGDVIPALQSTMTGRRLNAYAALTCSNSEVLSLMTPYEPQSLGSVGKPFVFTALHLNCESPGGPVTVTVADTGVALHDDGQGDDEVADDGIYSGSWTPSTPGIYAYTVAGETRTVIVDPYTPDAQPMNWRDITSSGTGLSLGTYYPGAARLDLPFPVSFAGRGLFSLSIWPNGMISAPPNWMPLDASTALPFADADIVLAPFEEALYADGYANTRNVFWGVLGQAPNRELVIEWRNMPHSTCPASTDGGITFQVVLFEDKTDVLYNYKDVSFGGACASHDNGATANVGLQVGPASAVQHSFQKADLAPDTSLLWTLNAEFPQNPAPTLSRMEPSFFSTTAYWYSVGVTAVGTNLLNRSVFIVDGKPREVYYSTPSSAGVILMSQDLAQAHTAKVQMFNALPGGGRSQVLDYEIKQQDYTLELSTNTVDLSQFTSGTATVTVRPAPVLIDPIEFTCTTSDPRVSCSFTFATRYGNLDWPVSSQLIIQRSGAASAAMNAPVQSTALRPSRVPAAPFFAFTGIAAVGFVGLGGSRRRLAGMLTVILLIVATQFACGGGGGGGGGYHPPTPPLATITATPTSIGTGQSALLSWSTSNATTITLDGVTVTNAGTKSVSPSATTTYHLLAKGSGGSKEATATVTVINTTTATVTVKVNSAGIERTATVSVLLPS